MSDVYRVGEDATSEKSLVMTPDTNPQHAYVANYLWFFFIKDRKFHIAAFFKETPEIEYQSSVKIWFKDEHFSYYERSEPFPFEEKCEDTYDIEYLDWTSIEVTFKVTKLYGEEYIGPADKESENEDGLIVNVANQKIFLCMETIVSNSEVFNKLRDSSSGIEITLLDVDPEVFLEMLRVLNPPHKRISRFYFTEFLLLACRFRMYRLLVLLDDFSRTDEYDKNWITRHSWKKFQLILQEDPSFSIQVLESFRVKRRMEKPVRRVKIRDPEIQSVHLLDDKKSWFGEACEYFAFNKSKLIFTILSIWFLEHVFIFTWKFAQIKKPS